MPQYRIEYSILLSSPSDLAEERKAAEEVVSEVSNLWGTPSGAVLRLLSWEKDVSPGFSAEPQEVINSSLGESWDIYLGLMHVRFGTPTKKFGSGTEEEFEKAYDLWEKNKKQRVLMFYFKNGSVDPTTIDLNQLSKVRAFKSKLPALGGLYREFHDTEMFKNLFRAHLTSVLSELHKNQTSQKTDREVTIHESNLPTKDETNEPGLLDLMEFSLHGIEAMTTAIGNIGSVMTHATKNIVEAQKELEAASTLGDIPSIRKGVTRMCEVILSMAKELADARRDYGTASRAALDSYSRTISAAKTVSSNGIGNQSALIQSITGISTQIEEFITILYNTERTMNSIPNISKSFASARLVLKKEYAHLRAELNTTVTALRELKDILDEN